MKGHIRRRGKNSYAVVLDIGADETGRRKQKWHSIKGSRKEAQAYCAKLILELTSGTYVLPASSTTGEYLDHWLKTHSSSSLSAKTAERYAQLIASHINPALAAVPLSKLRPLDIQRFYSIALTTGRKRGHGGLSKQTVLHIHRLLHVALKQAVEWHLRSSNPADGVKAPRPTPKEMVALEPDQATSLIASLTGLRLRLPSSSCDRN